MFPNNIPIIIVFLIFRDTSQQTGEMFAHSWWPCMIYLCQKKIYRTCSSLAFHSV